MTFPSNVNYDRKIVREMGPGKSMLKCILKIVFDRTIYVGASNAILQTKFHLLPYIFKRIKYDYIWPQMYTSRQQDSYHYIVIYRCSWSLGEGREVKNPLTIIVKSSLLFK